MVHDKAVRKYSHIRLYSAFKTEQLAATAKWVLFELLIDQH
jgi:hypothetical protein